MERPNLTLIMVRCTNRGFSGLNGTFRRSSFLNVPFSPQTVAANVTLVRIECTNVTFARND
jgi:hypothetical protein